MARSSNLTTSQRATWRQLLLAHDQLLDRIDAELTDSVGLTLGEFEVLVLLDEAEGHQMRMNELAVLTRLSPSGLTRRFDSLVRRGWVTRTRSADDGRGILAGVTAAGRAKATEGRPVHEAAVRRWCFDRLGDAEAAGLAAAVAVLAEPVED